MILQELIRNIVLYKGVVKPVLQSWTDTLFVRYTKQNYLPVDQRAAFRLPEAIYTPVMADWDTHTGVSIGDISLADISGTRTISYFDKGKYDRYAAGNNVSIVLMDDLMHEYVVESSKTYSKAINIKEELSTTVLSKTMSTTTGYANSYVSSFLSLETHEKREYLGEFSLTHEEAQLQYLLRGGEHHDTDQKPATAIV